MNNNKKNFIITMVFVIATLTTVSVIGNYMFVGWWYYSAIPTVAYFITLYYRPKVSLLLGINFAIITTYIPYFYVNMTASRAEGLLGLGHLYSLLGLAIGIAVSACYIGNKEYPVIKTFLAGFLISLLFFFINQLIVCNSVMYCGCFSL